MTGDYTDNGIPFLSDSDRAELETGSGITRDFVEAGGFVTVQDKHELPRYQHAAQGYLIPALVVPLHSVDGKTVFYQLKPHTPRLDKNDKIVKYENPHKETGFRNLIECNPLILSDVRDIEKELILTEGAKKSAGAASRGLTCVSINGVSAWRNPQGPLPCWESIPLKGRSVVLAFDSDFRTKPAVHRALTRLAIWLRSKGAIVRFCLLPEGEGGKKTGLDDYFVNGGNLQDFRRLLADELPPLTLDAKLAGFATTDTGNAERLAARFGEDLRYCHTWKQWLVWDGKRWQRDETGQALQYAKKTACLILAEAAATSDDAMRAALVKWSNISQSLPRLKALLELAQSLPDIAAVADHFDTNPHLLNVENGTIDLQTGTLQEFDRADLITKLTPIAYDAQAACPKWERFLETVLPDADVLAFLRRAVGYSLSGEVCEQVLFFLYGKGKNGKSTFIETVKLLSGEYASHLRADILMLDRNGPNKGATPEIAGLRGSRFVSVSELSDGQRLDEAQVKALTGGDEVAGRPLYQKEERFPPTFKFWLAGNYRPDIRGNDEGIWRRPKLIPFLVQIPPDQRDKDLKEKLRVELPGILAWAVRGALEWQRDGLNPPACVEAATQEYRAESDALAPFLEDRCVFQNRAEVTKAALWKAYQQWAEQTGESAYRTQRRFQCRAEIEGKHQRSPNREAAR